MSEWTPKQKAADEACRVASAHHQAACKVLQRAIANRDKSIEQLKRLDETVEAADAATDVAWAEYEAALQLWAETR